MYIYWQPGDALAFEHADRRYTTILPTGVKQVQSMVRDNPGQPGVHGLGLGLTRG